MELDEILAQIESKANEIKTLLKTREQLDNDIDSAINELHELQAVRLALWEADNEI